MGALRILNEHGDTAVVWNRADQESVRVAKEEFERLIGRGWLAFARDDGATAEDTELVRRFPESAAEVICMRPLVGG